MEEDKDETHIRCVVGYTEESGAFRKVTVIDVQKDERLWRQVVKETGRVTLV